MSDNWADEATKTYTAPEQAVEEQMQMAHVKQLRRMVEEPSSPEKIGLLTERIEELERREALLWALYHAVLSWQMCEGRKYCEFDCVAAICDAMEPLNFVPADAGTPMESAT